MIKYPKILNINRSKRIWRFLLFFSGLVLLLIIIFLIGFLISKPGRIEIDYLNIGQGDAELIKTPSHKLILIDGGPDNLVLWQLGKSLAFYQKKIDYLILSHYHDDHLIGLIEIIKRYHVKNLIYSDKRHSISLNNLLKTTKENGVKLIVLENFAKINLEAQCFLNILNPESLKIPDDQNNSLVAKLECKGNKFLFSGDNSLIVERALLNSNFNLKADVLKASHHGSNSANSEVFLKAVAPIDFVISDGLNNKFKHPSPIILERASAQGINIFRTDKQGTIRIFGVFR